MKYKRMSALPGALTLVALTACTGASIYAPMPQSAFTPPNSDVVPGEHVKATVSRSFFSPFQTPVIPDAKLQQEAYFKALEKSGADLIIDGDYSSRITIVPLIFITVFTVEGTVEGTSARINRIGVRR